MLSPLILALTLASELFLLCFSLFVLRDANLSVTFNRSFVRREGEPLLRHPSAVQPLHRLLPLSSVAGPLWCLGRFLLRRRGLHNLGRVSSTALIRRHFTQKEKKKPSRGQLRSHFIANFDCPFTSQILSTIPLCMRLWIKLGFRVF